MGAGVERGEGLVQEHGLRAICQSTGELNAASLASRELPDRQVEQALGQKLDQKGPSLAAIDRSPRDKEHVVDGVEPLDQAHLLPDGGDPLAGPHASPKRRELAEDGAKQGRLTRPRSIVQKHP